MSHFGEKRKLNHGVASTTVVRAQEVLSNATKGGEVATMSDESLFGKDFDLPATPPLAEEHDAGGVPKEHDEVPESCGFAPESMPEPVLKQKQELKGRWLESEDKILIESQAQYGNKWMFIATLLPGRSENAVKNRWKGPFIQKKIVQMKPAGSTNDGNTALPTTNKAASHTTKPPTSPCTDEPTKFPSAEPALKKQKLADEGKKQARPRNRPSRSKAAMAERERQKAAEKERDEEAVQCLFGEDTSLSEKEKDLIRRSYALGFTKGIKGNRKKGNLKAKPQAPVQQPPKRTPNVTRRGGLWSEMVQWEFSNPLESPPPLLELEHTLAKHGIDLDFIASQDDTQTELMEEEFPCFSI